MSVSYKPFSELAAANTLIAADIIPVVTTTGGNNSKKITYETFAQTISSTLIGPFTNTITAVVPASADKWNSTYTTVSSFSATWGNPSGGFTIFRQISSIASPNTSTTVHALSIISGETNVDIAILSKGTGATLAQIPNTTNLGGSKRGQYATDFQKLRVSPSQVASGNYSVIGGGYANTAGTASYTTVGGGDGNTADGQYSVVAGGVSNRAQGTSSTVGGGESNIAGPNQYPTIGGGYDNTASGDTATVAGGSTNIASGPYSTIGGGYRLSASGDYSTVGGGRSNRASGNSSTVGGGYSVSASGNYTTVGGGYQNIAGSELIPNSTVGGGRDNNASGIASTIGGGRNNKAEGNYSTVGGGGDEISYNNANGNWSTVGGGVGNIASGNYSSIIGGQSNNTNSKNNAHIIGSNITAPLADYTYVNNLSTLGNITSNTAVVGTLTATNSRVTNLTATTTTSTTISAATYQGIQAVKAWVNFDGTGIVGSDATINASYNINFVRKNNQGIYTVVFANAFANANYIMTGTGTGNMVLTPVISAANSTSNPINKTTLSCAVAILSATTSRVDSKEIGLMFIGS